MEIIGFRASEISLNTACFIFGVFIIYKDYNLQCLIGPHYGVVLHRTAMKGDEVLTYLPEVLTKLPTRENKFILSISVCIDLGNMHGI